MPHPQRRSCILCPRIGTGPAGISAAITAKVRNKNIILFGTSKVSEKVKKAHKILNYPGLLEVTGEAFYEKLYEHLKMLDIEVTDKKITTVYSMGDYFALQSGSDMYEAKTVILATGVVNSRELPGENEWLGRGVSYCATCDAPLYKDKIVTIIAYNKHEESEANFLAQVASKVYYIPMYKEEVEVDESIEIIKDTPVEIVGEQFVQKLILKNNEIETDGLFILRDSISPGQLVPGLELDKNHVQVDRKMATNLKGCFAAGDIVGTPYQYIKAAGEGNIAALSAVSYLDELKRNSK